jgi:PPP family 3-phenylpropionic acid transporter
MSSEPASQISDRRAAEPAAIENEAGLPVLRACLVYVASFSGAGLNQAYLPAWLLERGLGPSDIALALGAPMLMRLVAAPIFGRLADGSNIRAVVRIMAITALALACSLSTKRASVAILIFAPAMLLASQSINPLVDASVASLIRRGVARDFGRIRLWGSASFAAMTVTGGFVMGWGGPDAVFQTYILTLVMLVAASLLMPSAAPISPRSERGKLALLRRPLLLVVFVVAALILASHTILNSFGTVYWRALGYPADAIGLLWGLATCAEILMFWIGAAIGRRLGPFGLLVLAAGGATARWSLMGLHPGILATAALQLLHATTFSATWLGLMGFVQSMVEDEVGARAQSAFATVLGLVTAAMTFAAGPLYERLGASAFEAATLLPLIALALLLFHHKELRSLSRAPAQTLVRERAS